MCSGVVTMRQPIPGFEMDPIGSLLRDLDRTCTDLQFIDPVRLYGDGEIIHGAILALTIIQQRIRALQPAEAAE
jgi:hypothetical protein